MFKDLYCFPYLWSFLQHNSELTIMVLHKEPDELKMSLSFSKNSQLLFQVFLLLRVVETFEFLQTTHLHSKAKAMKDPENCSLNFIQGWRCAVVEKTQFIRLWCVEPSHLKLMMLLRNLNDKLSTHIASKLVQSVLQFFYSYLYEQKQNILF